MKKEITSEEQAYIKNQMLKLATNKSVLKFTRLYHGLLDTYETRAEANVFVQKVLRKMRIKSDNKIWKDEADIIRNLRHQVKKLKAENKHLRKALK